MKKFFKILGKAILLIVVIVVCIIAFNGYTNYKKDMEELSYLTKIDWEWHKKYRRIQINTNKETKQSTLRKVKLHDNQIIYAYINTDYSLGAIVQFIVDCEPNSIISSTQKFSNGKPKTLQCNEGGTSLMHGVTWSGKDTSFLWEENLDGFEVYENFALWDFTKLKKEITLLKAKKIKK